MNRQEIRTKIEAEITKTEIVLSQYEESTQPITPDAAIGRLSRMDAIQNKSVAEAALRQTRDKLSKLKFALSNIDNPDWGTCAKCKAQIPIGRILIKPESPYCVNCAQ
jgi:DnaK suppressor protein